MHIYLVDGEMLLCMPMKMIIDGPNLYSPLFYTLDNNYVYHSVIILEDLGNRSCMCARTCDDNRWS